MIPEMLRLYSELNTSEKVGRMVKALCDQTVDPPMDNGEIVAFNMIKYEMEANEKKTEHDLTITRSEFDECVATLNRNFSNPLTEYDVDYIWAHLESKQFRYRGVIITKKNCGKFVASNAKRLIKRRSRNINKKTSV